MDNNQGYYDSATPNPSGDYAYGKTITFTITYEFCSANYPAVGSGDVKEYYGYIMLGQSRHFVFQTANDATCGPSTTLQLRDWPDNILVDNVYSDMTVYDT